MEEIEPNLKIAPLLLVILIENAFKFVSGYSDRENKICIHLSTKASVLHCSIWNTRNCNRQILQKSNGIGVANLNRRLELLYPGEFTTSRMLYYETILNINFTEMYIVEDEPIARRVLQEFIEELEYLELKGHR